MALNGSPEARYYSHPNSLSSGFPSKQPSPRVPSARVAGTRGQPREFRQAVSISQSDETMKKHNKERPSGVGWLSGGATAKAKQKLFTDEASIKQPASRQPPRQIRPSIERISGPVLLHPPQGPRVALPSEQPTIDPRNLGAAWEALHSHPPQVKFAKRPILPGDKDVKARHRKVVICEKDEDESIVFISPRPSEDLSGSRRQSRVLSQTPETRIQAPYKPEGRKMKDEEKRVEQPLDNTIPTITVCPPSPSDNHANRRDRRLLSVENAYKSIIQDRENKNRSLDRHLRKLQPLAWLISEAEGIDINDTNALAEALRNIIEDRQMLMNTLPLAVTLCADQGIELNDGAFEALPRALDKVLSDRERAQFVASHHKRARKMLEYRVSRLEHELLELKQAS